MPIRVSDALAPLLETILGRPFLVRFEFWDGSFIGSETAMGTVHVRSVNALRQLIWSPGELGLARAFVSGDIDVDGDLFDILRVLQSATLPDYRRGLKVIWAALRAGRQLDTVKAPPPVPLIEARPRGRLHSIIRDAHVISHHYDVGNDFYRLFLGPSLAYSCARFTSHSLTLEEAQSAKHELICRKLGLAERAGMRLLDVGCGWGSMALHAATVHGATVVGITLSRPQAELAQERVADAGLSGKVDIRVQDWRGLRGETFDAISSIGMAEHVGRKQWDAYGAVLRELLAPQGRLLNQAISSVGGSRIQSNSFIGRYVFPDGELIDVGDSILALERAGFEIRDVESLREHYALTLRAWVANLDAYWHQAVSLVGEERARVWRLYMAGSVLGFEDGGLGLHQVLCVLSDETGRSSMPLTRRGWG